MAVAGRRADPAEPAGDAPAVGVDRENAAVEGVHHHAAGDLFADAGKRSEEGLALVIAEVFQGR